MLDFNFRTRLDFSDSTFELDPTRRNQSRISSMSLYLGHSASVSSSYKNVQINYYSNIFIASPVD